MAEKLHIIWRRNFEEDIRRHFAGTVTAISGPLIRVEGYADAFHPVSLHYEFRPDLRTKLYRLLDAGVIVHVLPPNIRIEDLRYRLHDGSLVVTDRNAVALDINEYNGNS